ARVPLRGQVMAQLLVVDDDSYTRALLRVFLQREGHEVREAGDGDGALQAAALRPPELVLYELLLRGRSGPETIREVARMVPGVRVVVMSRGAAGDRPDSISPTVPLGASAILRKPFSRRAVLEAVNSALGIRRPAATPSP